MSRTPRFSLAESACLALVAWVLVSASGQMNLRSATAHSTTSPGDVAPDVAAAGPRSFVAEAGSPVPDPSPRPTGAIFYVSDCREGADPDCIDGRDSNVGADPSAPWKTYEKARREFSRLEPGQAIAFARGGVFSPSDKYTWNNKNCRATSPCFILDYTPPWASGNEQRPRIVSGGFGFDFSNSGDPRHHEGYVLRNLVISGDTGEGESGRWGIFLYNDVDDVLLENLVIEGFGIGVHLATGKGDASSDRITLRNSRIVNNRRHGWLGGSTQTRIENNHFENNGFAAKTRDHAARLHNLYFGGKASTGGVVRGNTLYRSVQFDHDGNPQTPAGCSGTSLVVHGNHKGLLIEGNTVYEDRGTAARSCYGITADRGDGYTAFEGLTIRRNRVVNVGAVSIGCTSCRDATIENNVIVQQGGGFTASAIVVPSKSRGKRDGPTSDVRVLHNSIYFDRHSGASAISVGGEGTGHAVVGNAVHYAGTGRMVCFALDLPYASYLRIDRNTCYHPTSPNAVWVEEGERRLDLTSWQARSGFDQHSAIRDPRFAAPGAPGYDLALTAGSSGPIDAADAGMCPADDFDRNPRSKGRSCDIGAFEFARRARTRSVPGASQ